MCACVSVCLSLELYLYALLEDMGLLDFRLGLQSPSPRCGNGPQATKF